MTSGDVFGTREYLKNNYLYRMAAAAIGIYGNSKQEAMYPVYRVDADGQKLDGANRYTLHFAPGKLPPVNAFWSLTMYELPESLLVANPINRYLHQLADAAGAQEGCRRRDHALHPERVAGQGPGSQLAARAEGSVLRCTCVSTGRRRKRSMASGRNRSCGRRRRQPPPTDLLKTVPVGEAQRSISRSPTAQPEYSGWAVPVCCPEAPSSPWVSPDGEAYKIIPDALVSVFSNHFST